MPPLKVEGIDYTPEGIESVRAALIKCRYDAMNQLPESVNVVIILTHTIALLAYLKELVNGNLQV